MIFSIYFEEEKTKTVQYKVLVNGVEKGMISAGETINLEIDSSDVKLSFIPNAPRSFGWQALDIAAQVQSNPKLNLAVQIATTQQLRSGAEETSRTRRKASRNLNNQLHVRYSENITALSETYIKKYER